MDINKISFTFDQNKISSTFFRIERPIGDGFTSVIEFHTVVSNGNKYYRDYELRPDGSTGYLGKEHPTTKELGNKAYKHYLSMGYKLTGKGKMDIYGCKKFERSETT